ncbi:D-mannonate oxidoreductase [Caballeronia grimmiae]|uniref:D-mannonate oxidoreductase n=1 Tax=Caballeronia grimmiae TaxID=1071679 RepID=A0A069NFB2_9BURK|nr:D-mannonate oxidoreductase [Caballeronia grimmiae]KDR26394.1 D-mannonate oxidoreductase [Caballeronia grimmiae]
MNAPILQFGTSRFLLAHAALFVSEALARGAAIGGITIVQTTQSASSRARIAALKDSHGYPVHVRGYDAGSVVDRVIRCHAVQDALVAGDDWPLIRRAFVDHVRVVVSNTSDAGYRLHDQDSSEGVEDEACVPHSFPAKLLALLHARWRERPEAGVTVFPCELVQDNGDTLRDIVAGLAGQWSLPASFIDYMRNQCVWVNSLVDRIVSQAIEPVGAVAEPYALWAIERRPGMELPCTHDQIVVTDDLRRFERLKLFFLNLGHTWLAEGWLREQRDPSQTVFDAMNDPLVRNALESVWYEEVLPVFRSLGSEDEAARYIDSVRDRFLNPFLGHRIADIAVNHEEKVRRRILPFLELAASQSPSEEQPRLRSVLKAHGIEIDTTASSL